MLRKLVLLFLLAVFTPNLPAVGFPPKVVTCELFLKTALDVADYNRIRSSLRSFKGLLEAGVAPSASGAFKNIYYHGSLWTIDPLLGPEVLARVNALDFNLNNTNPDMQLIAIEFRGENFAMAHDLFLVRGPELREIYRRAYRQAFPIGDRVAAKVLNTFVALGGAAHLLNTSVAAAEAIANPSASQIGWAVLYTAMSYFPVALARSSFKHNVGRRDLYHNLVLKFAEDVWRNRSPDRFVVAGSHAVLPHDYHRMLMDYNVSTEVERRGRIAGLHELGSGMMLKHLSELTSGRIISVLTNLASYRSTYLDHIIFVDIQTGEPVWLIVYRAFRPRFGGRKRLADENQRACDWLPGAKPAGEN